MSKPLKIFRPIKVISDREGKDFRCYRDLFDICSNISRSKEMDQFQSLDELIIWLKNLPFKADNGGHSDCRCKDGDQRLIPWSGQQNCWEKTAHFISGIIRFGLPIGAEEILIIDWLVNRSGRHIFPVVRYHGNQMLVVDLDQFDYSRWLPWVHQQYDHIQSRSNDIFTNEWYNDLLGGVHLVGKTVLGAFGMGGLAETIEQYEAEKGALPEWAITNEKNKPKPKQLDKAVKKPDTNLTAKNVTDKKDADSIDIAIAKLEAMQATQQEMVLALKRQKEAMAGSRK